MLNPNSTQLRGPPLCYRTQHALPCSDLSGLFSPLIAFFFPPLFFFASFFFSVSSRNQDLRQICGTDYSFILSHLYKDILYFLSIWRWIMKIPQHVQPCQRVSLAALSQIYLKVFVKFCWQIGFKRPLIGFWWWSRSGVWILTGCWKGQNTSFTLKCRVNRDDVFLGVSNRLHVHCSTDDDSSLSCI